MTRDFTQCDWNRPVSDECRELIRLAMTEDLGLPDGQDITSAALVDQKTPGRAAIVTREPISVAGLPAAELVVAEYGRGLQFTPRVVDGAQVEAGTSLAEVSGPAASLLAAERVLLNFLGRLCGIATQTRRYVDAVAETGANIYDTRKTTPGWRRIEKYAVRCGGGRNHRSGLYDAVLIKDNHLAFGATRAADVAFTPAQAVRRARQFVEQKDLGNALIEIEVDTLEQLEQVLPEVPDIVLLDNMTPEQLRDAVAMRAKLAPGVELDASGGVTIDNVHAIAQTGVERISIGALTHAARWVDIGLDWSL